MPVSPPGRPVRGSRTGRPIMAVLELLGRRWALRILWELGLGAATFAMLRDRCDGMSPSVLAQRLAELRGVELVALGPGGYTLTDAGTELGRMLLELDGWAKRWATRLGRRPVRPGRAPRAGRSGR